MRIVGPEIWGPPPDRPEAMRTLRRLPELGVNFIDTANSYGPDLSEELIHEALHPYDGLCIATKGGLVRIGAEDRWLDGRPEHLIAEAKRSCDKLGVSSLDLWQLHRIDGEVPMDEQFGAIKTLLDDGIIRHAGLMRSLGARDRGGGENFPRGDGAEPLQFPGPAKRDGAGALHGHGIGFIPWYPLRAGVLAGTNSSACGFRCRRQATPAQVALAYLLHLSPVMLPIPGTPRWCTWKKMPPQTNAVSQRGGYGRACRAASGSPRPAEAARLAKIVF